jgi:peroxiredoxin
MRCALGSASSPRGSRIERGSFAGTVNLLRIIGAALALASMSATVAAEIAARPESVQPLLVGAQVPGEVPVLTEQGKPTTLRQAMAGRAALIIFHRGGWCPYCDMQLSELRAIEPRLRELGCQVIAITPDAPAALRRRALQDTSGYVLLSDQNLELTQAFGIAFHVDREKLGPAAANIKPVLPVPAVFIVDPSGVVRFQHVNPDYRVLVPRELLLAAAKASLPVSN